VATRFGAYEILHELRSGGMGAVLIGRRRGPGSFEQLVAIKTIRPEYAGAPAVRAMFLDEAAIVARINHPGIAAVHDFGEEGGTLYMAMEYVAGISFRGLLELDVPPGIAARAVAEACRGLHAAHEVRDTAGHVLGVVHRDISPDNLMLGFDGHVKVIDFGIALVKNRQAPVTELGTIKGKPPYMSPEQVKNEAMDRRSDVFSLAVVLHEMLTGQPLFDGDSIYAVARAVEHREIRPPSVVTGRPLPPGLDAAVMGALERGLGERTPTAAALAEQVERVLQADGGETLEAWAERALAGPREAHRRWLAEIAGGRDATRPQVGRDTGAVTQLPPEQLAALAAIAPPVSASAASVAPPKAAVAPAASVEPLAVAMGRAESSVKSAVAAAASVDPAGPTQLAAQVRPRRRGVLLLLALLALLGGIASVLLLLAGRRGEAPPDAAIVALADAADAADAPADAAAAPTPADAAAAPTPADAALPTEEPPPDGPPPDGPRRRPRDAGVLATPRDAGVPRAPRDAAAPPADARPAGTGRISIVGRGEAFLNILVDGQPFQVTPQLQKPIAAGSHTIVLLDPKTNQVVYQTTVVIEPGQHVRVQPP